MNMATERLLKIFDEIPENEVEKILDFAEYLKTKRGKQLSKDLMEANESSLDFWENDVDDKIWNNL